MNEGIQYEKTLDNQSFKVGEIDILKCIENGDGKNNNVEEFSPEAVRRYVKSVFENIYSYCEKQPISQDSNLKLSALAALKSNLKVLSGRNPNDRRKDSFREAAVIFFEELFLFVQEKEKDQAINKFLNAIDELFFSVSPNLSSVLDFDQHFDIAAEATRFKLLQSQIGGSIIDELAFNINHFYNPEAEQDKLLSGYDKSSLAEKLDKLNVMEILGAELIGGGLSNNDGDEKLIMLLEKIKKGNSNVLAGYYIDIVESRIRQEYETPSRGPIQMSNDPGNSRLWDNLSKKDIDRSKKLDNIIKPNRLFHNGEKIAQIAEDTVAVLDHANLPIAYAKINFSEKQEGESEISGSFLASVKEVLGSQKKGNDEIMISEFIGAVNNNIFIPKEKIKEGATERLALIWEKFGGLTRDEWQEYFKFVKLKDELSEKVEKFKKEEMEKTWEKNSQAALRQLEIFRREAPSIMPAVNNQYAGEIYKDFLDAYDAGNYDDALNRASELATAFHYMDTFQLEDSEAAAKIKKLADEFNKIRETHTANWDLFYREVNEYYKAIYAEFQDSIIRYNEIAGKIEQDKDIILNGFEAELGRIIDEEEKHKINVAFMPFKDFVERENGYFSKNIGIEESEFLFQHLYRPAMKHRIEDEFGIKLDEFPFCYHAHFLKFLSENNQKEAEKVKEFLNQGQSEAAKAQRVKSFLSLESGAEMGERILSIGESLRDQPEAADRLFAEYARMVDDANQEIEEIIRMYGEIFFQRGVDKDKVARAILRKAGSLLGEAGEALKNCDSDKREDLVEDLISHLKREDKAQKILISDFKKLAVQLNKMYHGLGRFNISSEKNKETDAEMTEFFKELKSEKIKLGEFKTEDIIKEIEQEKSILKKYDSQRLQDEIKFYESLIKMSDEIYEVIKTESGQEIAEKMREEHNKEGVEFYKPLVKKLKELFVFQKNFEQKLDSFIYGYETAGLPKNFQKEIKAGILNYQPEMAESEERPYLPVGVSSSLPEENEAHLKPIDALAYLFWLSNQKQGGELMVVDTMQKTNYQARYGLSESEALAKAAENGRRDKKWYSAAIAAHNLGDRISMADYGRLESDSETKKYADLLDELDDKRKCAPIARALNSLVEESRRKDVYGQEGGGTKENREKKNELLKQYGKAEIAFILSKGQIKIGHEKELRYDIIARVAAVYEQLASHRDEYEAVLEKLFGGGAKARNKIRQYAEPQGLVDLCLYLAYYKDFSDPAGELFDEAFEADRKTAKCKYLLQKERDSEKKSDLQAKFRQVSIEASSLKGRLSEMLAAYKKQQADADYYVAVHREALDKLKLTNSKMSKIMRDNRQAAAELLKEGWLDLKLPAYYYPKTITGCSFEMKKEGKDEFSDFREPYSTYKGATAEEIPIEANQVVASTSPMAAAKLLVLSEEKQREYCDKILKPLLVNYYKATSRTKEEAAERFSRDAGEAKTITDIIRLVQDKIVKPVEEKMAA